MCTITRINTYTPSRLKITKPIKTCRKYLIYWSKKRHVHLSKTCPTSPFINCNAFAHWEKLSDMYRCRDYRTTWGHLTRGYTAVIEQQLYVYMFYETAFAFKQNKTAIRDCRRISSISPWDTSQRSTLRRVGMFVYVNFYLLFFLFGNCF